MTDTPASAPAPGTRAQVVRDLAFDLQQALARQGRAPFTLSGLPLWADLQALHTTLGQCLQLAEDPRLRQWYRVLDELLPGYPPGSPKSNRPTGGSQTLRTCWTNHYPVRRKLAWAATKWRWT